MLDNEIASLNYQLESTNESGQEVISHLQETAQDPTPVAHKVEGVNSKWDELQAKLQELRDHVKDKVSLRRRHVSLMISSRIRENFVAGVIARSPV